jgi:septal ring factor EnvC (AmiA/AmiB activator)
MKTTIAGKDKEITEKSRKIESLDSEIRNQSTKMNDFLKRVAVESETTKKALEKSISSSVRLCVVAPTVNVHVNEGKSKFKSK